MATANALVLTGDASDLSNDPPAPSTLSTSTTSSSSLSQLQRTPSSSDLALASYMVRQFAGIGGGAVSGFILGVAHGSKTGGLRFRAENAHRLPTSTKGWYLYHKSKNYYAMWAGLRDGGRMALKLGFWTGAFVGVEESINCMRRKTSYEVAEDGDGTVTRIERRVGGDGDVLSTVCAGLAVAGAFSVWNRFPLTTAARTARMGLVFGVVYGLTQDAWRVATGKRVGYVEVARRGMGGGETYAQDG